ncbi:hypothetical protein CVT25_010929 [Psilocybe cyanescens]|uniref:Uncharacterized protein n=1 Tax=Psilocybe cyanescens TaxID=93625 RepID=A0A409WFS3_PSICY|nr:hypothetical protein CVT25_010929 [Psilocybe cyanescens]
MPTSELSDALNPYASQTRQRASSNDYSHPLQTVSYQPVVQPPQAPHAPHVSELQMAIPQPAPPSARSRQGAQVVAELFRRIASIQNAQEHEVKRRLVWEKEQEEKGAQKNAEMEQKMGEMYEELRILRSDYDRSNQPPAIGLLTPQDTMSPATTQQTNSNTGSTSPISPGSQLSQYTGPAFVQGSSSTPLSDTNTSALSPNSDPVNPTQTFSQSSPSHVTTQSGLVPATEPTTQAITPNLSPHLTDAETLRPPPRSTARSAIRKKKRKSYDSDDGSSCSSSSSSPVSRPRKRKSHHDTTCYTIHHAIRLHIIRMMDRETDKDLPDSHIEGTTLDPSEPVRFVWDKTTKQSVHNARMKRKILDDIKDNRHLYKDVPQKEFTKKNLDAAFDQCFITFRQKFKSQRDALSASHLKLREEAKARKARHLSRRKIKLDNRSEARNKIEMFEHVIFDGALHPDCMSSEESDYEQDPLFPQPNSYLKTHGYAWRSTRLLRFYCILDDEDRIESSAKPKRGQARKERRVGPNKEGFILPPQGVSTWMISRRWYKASLATHPDLPNTLTKLIVDPVGFDWSDFHELGEESGDEGVHAHPTQQTMSMYDPHMHTMGSVVEHQGYSASVYTNYA